jgi:hypothetical protein
MQTLEQGLKTALERAIDRGMPPELAEQVLIRALAGTLKDSIIIKVD